MTVYQIGSKVHLGDGLTGTVIGLSITGTERSVQYHVAWWDGNSRCSEWVSSAELSQDAPATMRIGFAK